MKPLSFAVLIALLATKLDVVVGDGWETITKDDFNNGWGNFKDGGVDAARRKNAGLFQGWAIRLRDDTSSSTMTHKRKWDVMNYKNLRVTFKFCAIRLEPTEGFELQIQEDGSSWDNLDEWREGQDFENGKPCFDSAKTKTVDFSTKSGTKFVKLRFKNKASKDNEHVYFSDVLFEGFRTGSTATTTPAPSTTTPGPSGPCHHVRLHWQYGYNWQQKGMDTPQDWCLTWDPDSTKSSALLKQCRYANDGRSNLYRRQQWKIEDGKIKMCDYNKCLTRTDENRGKWVVVADCVPSSDRQTFTMNDYVFPGSPKDFAKKHNPGGNGITCDGGDCTYEGTFREIYRKFPVYIWKAKGWKDSGNGARCLTNFYHHPKTNEAMHLAQCVKLKSYRTIFWNFEARGFGHEVDN